jgi:hypothetical protein
MTHDEQALLGVPIVFAGITPMGAVRVAAELRYDTRRPYAVDLVLFDTTRRKIRWTFARDLMADGLIAEAGEGDVRVRPAPGTDDAVVLELFSSFGPAMFVASTRDWMDFLNRTYTVVPRGTESWWLHIDEELERLLSTGPAD